VWKSDDGKASAEREMLAISPLSGKVAFGIVGWVTFCRLIWYSADGIGYHPSVSNGNGAAALMLTVAILAGMHHVHGSSARRHTTSRHWSSPERAELGDAKIPVRSIRTRTTSDDLRTPSRPRVVAHETQGKSAPEQAPSEVIVGYVDPNHGPKAFHRLTKVVEGDRVKVVRHDHSVSWYKVDSIRRAVRRSLAQERSSSGRPELRLISWRGSKGSGHDPRDVVVSAHLDRPKTPGE
jgi:hypothetical protein